MTHLCGASEIHQGGACDLESAEIVNRPLRTRRPIRRANPRLDRPQKLVVARLSA